MAAIFGILNKDGSPVEGSELKAMGRLCSYRSPEGNSSFTRNQIGLGGSNSGTAFAPQGFGLPAPKNGRNVYLAADLRIDNRSELVKKLRLNSHHPTSLSDSDLLLSLFSIWGPGIFPQLIGDFAFAIWSESERKLFCGRDYIGTKPLYYYESQHKFIFSSDIKSLVLSKVYSKRVDVKTVAEFLCDSFIDQESTLYAGIKRVPPAHYIEISPENSTLVRYWSPCCSSRLKYRDEAEYVEHFQEIFSQAVKSRLDTNRRVAAELSGGLDSSTIFAKLEEIREGTDCLDPIHFYSLAYPGKTCDESYFVERIKTDSSAQIRIIDGSQHIFSNWSEQVAATMLPPAPPNLSNSDILVQTAQKDGVGVILTGLGGDDLFCGSRFPYYRLLINGDLALFMKEFRRASRLSTKMQAAKEILASLCWPFLPAFSKRLLVNRFNARQFPPWVSPTLLQESGIKDKVYQMSPYLHSQDLASSSYFETFNLGYLSYVLETYERRQAEYQVEGRHPFFDRRLAEFAFALPQSLKSRNGESKYILRCAGRGKLAEEVRTRTEKSEYSWLFSKAFSAEPFLASIRRMEIEKQGWLSREKYLQHYTESIDCFASTPGGPCERTWPLWFGFSINLWYSILFAES